MGNPFQTTRSAIDYWESTEGYGESWNDQTREVTRLLFCRWDDRIAFIEDLLGYSYLKDIGGGNVRIQRYIPEQLASNPNIYCVGAQLVAGKGIPVYDPLSKEIAYFKSAPADPTFPIEYADGFAYYTTTWRQVPWEVLKDYDEDLDTELDRYVIREETYSGESVTLPGASFQFEDTSPDRVVIPEPIPQFLFSKELTRTWVQVPVDSKGKIDSRLETNIDAVIGCMNQYAIDGYPVYTLLCMNPAVRRLPMIDGNYCFEISYKWLYRPDGWDKIYRKDGDDGPGFYRVVSTENTSVSIYQKADFGKLFRLTP